MTTLNTVSKILLNYIYRCRKSQYILIINFIQNITINTYFRLRSTARSLALARLERIASVISTVL